MRILRFVHLTLNSLYPKQSLESILTSELTTYLYTDKNGIGKLHSDIDVKIGESYVETD